ncbi:MAG TPA: VTT domain-containing protein [Gemmatimonadaceae bacterium]|jgi:uncharacterized membrane protein YdjX (TVP38/TMEM64 family)|nr:VTT domain-containing protein [Gemmatimonadaceae bacterium]
MRRYAAPRAAGVLAVLAVAVWGAHHAGLFGLHDRAALAAAIEQARAVPFLAVVFVAIYAFGAAVGVPATPLTLAGGALFGVAQGIVLNWLGELLAALLAFGITRATGLRAQPSASGSPNAFASPRARAMLFRLRLVPVAPFALLNAGAAIAGMGLRDYTIATAAGILPITIIYTVSASELLAGVEGSGARALGTGLAAAAILVALTFLPAMVRRLRRADG